MFILAKDLLLGRKSKEHHAINCHSQKRIAEGLITCRSLNTANGTVFTNNASLGQTHVSEEWHINHLFDSQIKKPHPSFCWGVSPVDNHPIKCKSILIHLYSLTKSSEKSPTSAGIMCFAHICRSHDANMPIFYPMQVAYVWIPIFLYSQSRPKVSCVPSTLGFTESTSVIP